MLAMRWDEHYYMGQRNCVARSDFVAVSAEIQLVSL
jgi:hypothetical protein